MVTISGESITPAPPLLNCGNGACMAGTKAPELLPDVAVAPEVAPVEAPVDAPEVAPVAVPEVAPDVAPVEAPEEAPEETPEEDAPAFEPEPAAVVPVRPFEPPELAPARVLASPGLLQAARSRATRPKRRTPDSLPDHLAGAKA